MLYLLAFGCFSLGFSTGEKISNSRSDSENKGNSDLFFNCSGRRRGYYADVHYDCSVFYFCDRDRKYSYRCNDGKKFDEVKEKCTNALSEPCKIPYRLHQEEASEIFSADPLSKNRELKTNRLLKPKLERVDKIKFTTDLNDLEPLSAFSNLVQTIIEYPLQNQRKGRQTSPRYYENEDKQNFWKPIKSDNFQVANNVPMSNAKFFDNFRIEQQNIQPYQQYHFLRNKNYFNTATTAPQYKHSGTNDSFDTNHRPYNDYINIPQVAYFDHFQPYTKERKIKSYLNINDHFNNFTTDSNNPFYRNNFTKTNNAFEFRQNLYPYQKNIDNLKAPFKNKKENFDSQKTKAIKYKTQINAYDTLNEHYQPVQNRENVLQRDNGLNENPFSYNNFDKKVDHSDSFDQDLVTINKFMYGVQTTGSPIDIRVTYKPTITSYPAFMNHNMKALNGNSFSDAKQHFFTDDPRGKANLEYKKDKNEQNINNNYSNKDPNLFSNEYEEYWDYTYEYVDDLMPQTFLQDSHNKNEFSVLKTDAIGTVGKPENFPELVTQIINKQYPKSIKNNDDTNFNMQSPESVKDIKDMNNKITDINKKINNRPLTIKLNNLEKIDNSKISTKNKNLKSQHGTPESLVHFSNTTDFMQQNIGTNATTRLIANDNNSTTLLNNESNRTSLFGKNLTDRLKRLNTRRNIKAKRNMRKNATINSKKYNDISNDVERRRSEIKNITTSFQNKNFVKKKESEKIRSLENKNITTNFDDSGDTIELRPVNIKKNNSESGLKRKILNPNMRSKFKDFLKRRKESLIRSRLNSNSDANKIIENKLSHENKTSLN